MNKPKQSGPRGANFGNGSDHGLAGDLLLEAKPPPENAARPCAVLVVDEDRRAGAQTAARLLELGYTCGVTVPNELRSTLGAQPFDAVVIAVSTGAARRDQGRALSAALSEFQGAQVLISASPLDRPDADTLVKPFLIEALVELIESQVTARSPAKPAQRAPSLSPQSRVSSQSKVSSQNQVSNSPGSRGSSGLAVQGAPRQSSVASQRPGSQGGLKITPRSSLPMPMQAPAPRGLSITPSSERKLQTIPARGASSASISGEWAERTGHTTLSEHVVRVVLSGIGDGGRGRALSIDPRGELLVECKPPPEKGRAANAIFTLVDGRKFELKGMVSQVRGQDAMLTFQLQPKEQRQLAAFLQHALDRRQPSIEPIRIRQSADGLVISDILDVPTLSRRWDEIAQTLDDDEAQQRFIQDCLKAQQLEFAVQCYRELKADRPGDVRIDKYLQQVGTILGFYALKKVDAQQEQGLSRSVKIALGLFLVASICLALLIKLS